MTWSRLTGSPMRSGTRMRPARSLNNLGYTLMCWARPELAMSFARQTLAYAEAHEVHTLASYAATVIAWLLLRAGEWDEAERVTQGEIDKGITVTQLLAKTVLAELAVRRGDPDAADRLQDLAAQANRTGELQRITPVLELMTEFAAHPWRADADGDVPEDRHRLLATSTGWMECGANEGVGCGRRTRSRHRPAVTDAVLGDV